jgi:DNA-binding MarR family transcriptional regulator
MLARPSSSDEQLSVIEPVASAMDALRRIVRSLRIAERHTEVALGVTSAQLFVLREIDKAERITVGELARRTATAQSSVSEVLARLDARGLVIRTQSAVDRRRTEIALSDAGHALLSREDGRRSVQERLVTAFRRLPMADQSAISESMSAWVEAAEMTDVPASMFFEPLPPTGH